jgi:hypothetical protein
MNRTLATITKTTLDNRESDDCFYAWNPPLSKQRERGGVQATAPGRLGHVVEPTCGSSPQITNSTRAQHRATRPEDMKSHQMIEPRLTGPESRSLHIDTVMTNVSTTAMTMPTHDHSSRYSKPQHPPWA